LFDNQEAWSRDGDIEKYVSAALTPAEYKRVQQLMTGCTSTAAGVKPAKFSVNAAQGCALDAGIDKDVALGNQIQVGSTPTFVITCKGQRYPPASAAISYPVIKQFFDELLKQ
ncbi:MAG: DsbA family protein, partial [Candidatus Binataceae bacterium]